MKTIIAIILWFLLLVTCWPLAVALIFILPLLWLILLPFGLIGLTLGLVFKIIGSILMLPFRILGIR